MTRASFPLLMAATALLGAAAVVRAQTRLPSIDPGPLKPNDFGKSKALIQRAYAATASFLDGDRRAAAGS